MTARLAATPERVYPDTEFCAPQWRLPDGGLLRSERTPCPAFLWLPTLRHVCPTHALLHPGECCCQAADNADSRMQGMRCPATHPRARSCCTSAPGAGEMSDAGELVLVLYEHIEAAAPGPPAAQLDAAFGLRVHEAVRCPKCPKTTQERRYTQARGDASRACQGASRMPAGWRAVPHGGAPCGTAARQSATGVAFQHDPFMRVCVASPAAPNHPATPPTPRPPFRSTSSTCRPPRCAPRCAEQTPALAPACGPSRRHTQSRATQMSVRPAAAAA